MMEEPRVHRALREDPDLAAAVQEVLDATAGNPTAIRDLAQHAAESQLALPERGAIEIPVQWKVNDIVRRCFGIETREVHADTMLSHGPQHSAQRLAQIAELCAAELGAEIPVHQASTVRDLQLMVQYSEAARWACHRDFILGFA